MSLMILNVSRNLKIHVKDKHENVISKLIPSLVTERVKCLLVGPPLTVNNFRESYYRTQVTSIGLKLRSRDDGKESTVL